MIGLETNPDWDGDFRTTWLLVTGIGWDVLDVPIVLAEDQHLAGWGLAANSFLIALLIGLKSWLLAVLGLNAPDFLFDLTSPSWLWAANQLLPCMFAIIIFASLLPRIRRRATNAITQCDVVEIELLP